MYRAKLMSQFPDTGELLYILIRGEKKEKNNKKVKSLYTQKLVI